VRMMCCLVTAYVCDDDVLLGNGVLRRPSFEDKYHRTSSPAGSDVVTVSSRSDSPSAPWDSTQQRPSAPWDSAHRATADVYRTDVLSSAARPFAAVTSRPRSPAVVSSRPVSGPVRQVNTSPPAGVSPAVSAAQSVSCVTVAVSVNPPNGFQVAAATALLPAQVGFATSPLDCHRDVTVTSSPATARSSRPPTVVLQQVHSCEVAWPSAQRATAPAMTRLTHDTVTDSISSTRHDAAVTATLCHVTSALCHVTPATVLSSSVSFAPPYDTSTRSVGVVNMSSQQSTDSSSLSADVSPVTASPPALPEKTPATLSEKPPPPYPGRGQVQSPRGLRRAAPAPPSSYVVVSASVSVTDTTQDTDVEIGLAADDSTDEDVAMTTECQRIESPKPERTIGDDSRCETKVPAYQPIIS